MITASFPKSESTRPVPATDHVPAGWSSVTRSPTSTPSRSASGRESQTSPDCGRPPFVTVTDLDGVPEPGSSMATPCTTVPSASTIGAQSTRMTVDTSASRGLLSPRSTTASSGSSMTMSVPARHERVTGSELASWVRTSTLPIVMPNTGTAMRKTTRSERPGRRCTSRRARRDAKRHCGRPISRPPPASWACHAAAAAFRRRLSRRAGRRRGQRTRRTVARG